jgi:hypothetical protein
VLVLLVTGYRVGCGCGDSPFVQDAGPAPDAGAPDAGPSPDAGTHDAGTLTLLLKDPMTGSSTQTTTLRVAAGITGDDGASAWCLDTQPATAMQCDAGWQMTRPATYLLSPGDGLKTAWLTLDDGGTASASITVTGTPPAIMFHKRPVHISSARQAATLLSGWCGVPGAAVTLSGGGTAATSCSGDAGWSATVDFSAAPQGNVVVTGVLTTGELQSLPANHTLIKDTAFCDNPAKAGPFAGGTGVPGDPYLICTADQLAALDTQCDADALLRNDIIFDGGQFPGLCGGGGYVGTFDGDDFAVLNFTNDAGAQPIGLFIKLFGTVQNVSVEHVNVSGYYGVGAIVGQTFGGSIVRHCFSSGLIWGDNVMPVFHQGGIVGDQTGGDVLDSESSVDLSVPIGYSVGGLVGHAYAGTIQRCHASGSVYAGNNAPGGLVGRVGDDAGNSAAISDSYADGPVTSGGSQQAGGLVGEIIVGSVTRCYASGPVSGTDPKGGLVALITVQGPVTDSYWNVETTGLATSAGGETGLTSAQMSDAGSFPSWDFGTVWTFDPARSPFPVLRE